MCIHHKNYFEETRHCCQRVFYGFITSARINVVYLLAANNRLVLVLYVKYVFAEVGTEF